MAAELANYITKAREKELTDEQIKTQLVGVGWPSEQVAAALSQSSDLPVPPPPPSIPHVGMWVGFLYILFFIALYVLATAISGMLHIWITQNSLADASIYSDFSWSWYDIFGLDTDSVAQGFVAAIIVSYPLFLFLALLLKKQMIKQPSIKNLRSRKILIYITLIATFLIMLGNIISTIYDFLSGSVTNNVLGNLFITILIAGSIFGYFISEVLYDRKKI